MKRRLVAAPQSLRGGMYAVSPGFNGEASPAPSAYLKMPPPAFSSLTHSTIGPLPFYSHRNMYRHGPGVRPTEKDHERHRLLDTPSLACCQRHNEACRVLGLRIAVT